MFMVMSLNLFKHNMTTSVAGLVDTSASVSHLVVVFPQAHLQLHAQRPVPLPSETSHLSAGMWTPQECSQAPADDWPLLLTLDVLSSWLLSGMTRSKDVLKVPVLFVCFVFVRVLSACTCLFVLPWQHPTEPYLIWTQAALWYFLLPIPLPPLQEMGMKVVQTAG